MKGCQSIPSKSLSLSRKMLVSKQYKGVWINHFIKVEYQDVKYTKMADLSTEKQITMFESVEYHHILYHLKCFVRRETYIHKWNLLVYFRYRLTGLLFGAGGRQFSPLTILGKEDLTMFLAENRINTSFYKYCPSFSSTVIIYKISRSHAGVYSKKTWREFPF